MDDLISRQAAIDAIEHRLAEPAYQHEGEDWYTGMNCAESELYDLPPAQPEHPKGKWIKLDSYDRRDHFYACSECGRLINIICNAHLEDYPFCHCGADMRGAEDE